jgi:hypothetical protein
VFESECPDVNMHDHNFDEPQLLSNPEINGSVKT